MKLPLKELIDRNIIIPINPSSISTYEYIISDMVLLDDSIFNNKNIIEYTPLIFVPKGIEIDFEKINYISSICKNPVWIIDAFDLEKYVEGKISLLSYLQGKRFLVCTIDKNKTIGETIKQCFLLVQSVNERLANLSLEVMNKLSTELLHHRGRNDSLLKVIMEILECPVSFATYDFQVQKNPKIPKEYFVQTPFYSDYDFDWELALEGFSIKTSDFLLSVADGFNTKDLKGYIYQNNYCRQLDCKIYIIPIGEELECFGYLLLSFDENVKKLPLDIGVKLQQILSIMRFELLKSDEIAHTVNRYYDFFLDEIISSEETDFRALVSKYSLVQKSVYDQYVVFLVGRDKIVHTDIKAFDELLTSQKFNLLYDQLVSILDNINFFIFEKKEYIVTFIPNHLLNEHVIEKIIALFKKFLGDRFQSIGISDIVSPLKIRDGFLQAQKAQTFAYRFLSKDYSSYEDLGVLKYFIDKSNNFDSLPMKELLNKYILPLVSYDEAHNSELLITLNAYIECCASTSKICKLLFIHKNTLYSRLDKIENILNEKLSDSETILNISLALKFYSLMELGYMQN